jgi:Tol biopolymer transport system component
VRRAALAACWLLGCAAGPGVDVTALPEAPIAFVYRNVEETERLLDEAEAQRKAREPLPEDEFRMKLEGLEKLAGLRTEGDLSADREGRIALYVVPGKRLELPDQLNAARAIDWSDDHRRLMLSMNPRRTIQLFEWDVVSGEVRQLTSGPSASIDGCYGPDGAIAFVEMLGSVAVAKTRIWVHYPGERPRAVTEGPGDVQPTWSPDGARLVYTRVGGQLGHELRWLDPRTGEGGPLGAGRAADFTPDGRWIVYSARTTAGWQLRRMHADGSGKRALGRSGYNENTPAVSPDGRWVVYAAQGRNGSPIARLFVRSIDGGADRQLEIAGSGALPVW